MPPTAKQAPNKPKSTLKHKSSKNSHNITNNHPNNNKHNSKQSSISKANSNHHHQQQTSKRKTKTKQLTKKAKCKQPQQQAQPQQAQQQSSNNNNNKKTTTTNNNNNQKVSIQVPRLSSTSVGLANSPATSSRSSHSSPIDNFIDCSSPIDIPFNNHNHNNNVNINNIHNNYINNNNNQNNNHLLNGTSVEVFKSCLDEEDDGNSVPPQQSNESTRVSLCFKTAMPTEIEEEQFFESESPSQVEPIPALTPLCCTGRPHCVSPADILTHSKSRSNSKPIYRYRMTLTPESDHNSPNGTTANCIIPTTFDNQVSTSSSASQSGSVSTSSLQSSSQSAQPKFVPSNITAADSSFLFRTAIYPPELLKYSLLKAANMTTDSKFNWNSPRQLATSNSNEKLNTTAANNNKFRYAMPQVFRQPQQQVPPKPPPITQPPKSPDDYLDTDERSISNSKRNGR